MALGFGLLVIELITVPDWGLEWCNDDASDAYPLMTGVIWPGVTRGDAMEEREAGPGSTVPTSMLLLLRPVLRCGCVEGAGLVGRLISTQLCFEGDNRTAHGLLTGWARI